MSEKPMSSDIMMMMFGRDCAATVARPASPPCATASDNSKPADAVLIIMLFIFVKPPAANVSQEKWCARVLAGRDFALQAFRTKMARPRPRGQGFCVASLSENTIHLLRSVGLPPNPAREDAGAPTRGHHLYQRAISLLLLFSLASKRCSTANLQVACRAWP